MGAAQMSINATQTDSMIANELAVSSQNDGEDWTVY